MLLDNYAAETAGRPAVPGSASMSRQTSPGEHRRASVSREPEIERRLHDLQAKVLASLVNSGYAALGLLTCDVDGNQVILHGSVPSYHLKQLAQVFAQRVDGVGRIENRLQVSGSRRG